MTRAQPLSRADGWERETSSILRAAFEHAPVAIGLCDNEGILVQANENFGRLFGRTPGALHGTSFLELVHPDIRQRVLVRYLASLVGEADSGSGFADQTELMCLAADGSAMTVQMTWSLTAPSPAGEQYIVIHLQKPLTDSDIAAELAEVSHRFDLAFELSPAAISVVNVDGSYEQANSAFTTLFAYTQDELRTMTIQDLTHPDDLTTTQDAYRRLLDGVIDQHQTIKRYIGGDGRVILCRRTVAVTRRTDGSPEYFVVLAEPIEVSGRHSVLATTAGP